MQPKHLGHVQSGKALAGLDNRIGQAACHTHIAIQPTDSLHAFATFGAANTPEQDAQTYRATYNGEVTKGALAILMIG
jgi:hypothetical protein